MEHLESVPAPVTIDRKRLGEAILWQAEWHGHKKGSLSLQEIGISPEDADALFWCWFSRMGDLIRSTSMSQAQLDRKIEAALDDLKERLHQHRYYLDQDRWHRGVEWHEVVDDILHLPNPSNPHKPLEAKILPDAAKKTADLIVPFPNVREGGISEVKYAFENNDESPVVSSARVEHLLAQVHDDADALFVR